MDTAIDYDAVVRERDNYKWLLTKESADINPRLKRGRSNDDTLLPVNKVAKEDEGKKLTLLRASLETAKSGRCEQFYLHVYNKTASIISKRNSYTHARPSPPRTMTYVRTQFH